MLSPDDIARIVLQVLRDPAVATVATLVSLALAIKQKTKRVQKPLSRQPRILKNLGKQRIYNDNALKSMQQKRASQRLLKKFAYVQNANCKLSSLSLTPGPDAG